MVQLFVDSSASQNLEQLVSLRHSFSRIFPEKVSLDFTVAIPTYNGAERLAAVLQSLCWQLNVEGLAWEIIIVDNNSRDRTAEVVRELQATWPIQAPLRYVFERRQGAGYARNRAVQVAASPLIGFLDDDNLPGMTWIAAAHRFAQANPQVGVMASRIQGDFETSPPENFERIASLLALTERGPQPIIYAPERKVIPPSAGIVVRKRAWLDNVPDELVLTGRAGGSMIPGEDTESILHIQKAGWEVWYNPHMRLHHRIPTARLTRQYLMRLCRGIGLSRYRTRMLSVERWQRLPMLMLYGVNDIRKVCRHLWRYRWAVVQDDVAACEMMLYLASLVSPLYMAHRYFASSDRTRDGGQ
ncbi:MAG: glycosyltransferase family 2 protein [Leptolyngbya sp. SIO4C1]|nr:glycosyltransferase family 2 protein [Leptolyngbya sp. SIO4C1]